MIHINKYCLRSPPLILNNISKKMINCSTNQIVFCNMVYLYFTVLSTIVKIAYKYTVSIDWLFQSLGLNMTHHESSKNSFHSLTTTIFFTISKMGDEFSQKVFCCRNYIWWNYFFWFCFLLSWKSVFNSDTLFFRWSRKYVFLLLFFGLDIKIFFLFIQQRTWNSQNKII